MSLDYFPCLYNFFFKFQNSEILLELEYIYLVLGKLDQYLKNKVSCLFLKADTLSIVILKNHSFIYCSLHNFYYIEESWCYEAFLHVYSISRSLHKHFQSLILTEVFADRWLYSYAIISTHTKGEIWFSNFLQPGNKTWSWYNGKTQYIFLL